MLSEPQAFDPARRRNYESVTACDLNSFFAACGRLTRDYGGHLLGQTTGCAESTNRNATTNTPRPVNEIVRWSGKPKIGRPHGGRYRRNTARIARPDASSPTRDAIIAKGEAPIRTRPSPGADRPACPAIDIGRAGGFGRTRKTTNVPALALHVS